MPCVLVLLTAWLQPHPPTHLRGPWLQAVLARMEVHWAHARCQQAHSMEEGGAQADTFPWGEVSGVRRGVGLLPDP